MDIIIIYLAGLIIVLSLLNIRELHRLRKENDELNSFIAKRLNSAYKKVMKKPKVQYRKYEAIKDTVALTKGKKYKGKVVDGKVLLWYSGGYFGNFGTKNIKLVK